MKIGIIRGARHNLSALERQLDRVADKHGIEEPDRLMSDPFLRDLEDLEDEDDDEDS